MEHRRTPQSSAYAAARVSPTEFIWGHAQVLLTPASYWCHIYHTIPNPVGHESSSRGLPARLSVKCHRHLSPPPAPTQYHQLSELEVIRGKQNLYTEDWPGPEQIDASWNMSSLGTVELGSSTLPSWAPSHLSVSTLLMGSPPPLHSCARVSCFR